MGNRESTEQPQYPQPGVPNTDIPDTNSQDSDPEVPRPKPQQTPHEAEAEIPGPWDSDPDAPRLKEAKSKSWLKWKHRANSNEDALKSKVSPKVAYVIRKITKARPDMGENERFDLAECLCDKEKFKERYFDPLLKRVDTAVKATFEEAEEFAVGEGFPNEGTKKASEWKIVQGIDGVQSLQVELLLYTLKDGLLSRKIAECFHKFVPECTYGPYHAALKIGDLILEWDNDSLIIPYHGHPDEFTAPEEDAAESGRRLMLRATIHKGDEKREVINIPTRGGAEATAFGFQQYGSQLMEITEEKENLLDALAEVIVRYNTKFEYGTFSCNCQYFVAETLTALGITDQAERFREVTKNVFAAFLEKRKDKPKFEFNNHTELDEYVSENIEKMDRVELDFCHCHYLLFHAWSKQSPKKSAWRCDPSHCKSKLVSNRLPE